MYNFFSIISGCYYDIMNVWANNILTVFIINVIFLAAEHEWLNLVLLTLRTIRSNNCKIIASWEVEVDCRQNNAV